MQDKGVASIWSRQAEEADNRWETMTAC